MHYRTKEKIQWACLATGLVGVGFFGIASILVIIGKLLSWLFDLG